MRLRHIVLKDAMRRKWRLLYAALGVVIGTMTVVAVLTIARSGEARIVSQLEEYGPNLTVIPALSTVATSAGSISLGTITVGENYISEAALPTLRDVTDGEIRDALGIDDDEEIATIAPRLYVGTTIAGQDAIIVGIDPTAERMIRTWWRVADGIYMEGPDQAVAGAMLAAQLQLAVGDEISLSSGDVTVAGILQATGSSDDFQVFLPLPTVQAAFQKEGLISAVDIRALCNACPVEIIADSINRTISGVQAVAVRQVAEAEMAIMSRMNGFMLALAGITIAIGLFGVVNTMLTSVHERRMDIGIMRAVGASRGQIIRLFVYEGLIVGVIGGTFGYLAGSLLAYAVGPIIFDGTVAEFVPWYLPLSLALAVVVSAVATVYPAVRATRIKIAEAFSSL
jgi:putative ABC transport system permease protein